MDETYTQMWAENNGVGTNQALSYITIVLIKAVLLEFNQMSPVQRTLLD